MNSLPGAVLQQSPTQIMLPAPRVGDKTEPAITASARNVTESNSRIGCPRTACSIGWFGDNNLICGDWEALGAVAHLSNGLSSPFFRSIVHFNHACRIRKLIGQPSLWKDGVVSFPFCPCSWPARLPRPSYRMLLPDSSRPGMAPFACARNTTRVRTLSPGCWKIDFRRADAFKLLADRKGLRKEHDNDRRGERDDEDKDDAGPRRQPRTPDDESTMNRR